MQETIRKLLQLQEHDLRILDLTHQEAEARRQLAAERREVEEQIKQLEAEQDRLRHLQTELKHLEVELESRQQKKTQLEAQQAAVKRNVEYKAMMKEILDVQAAIRLTEDKILEKYEEIEQERQHTAVRDKEVAERRARLDERVRVVEGELHEIERRLAEIKAARKAAATRVEERALRLYERIFKNKRGAAVVPIVHRSCGGCHLAVTPQMENLTRHMDQIVQCENCARIFYVPEDEEAAESGDAGAPGPAPLEAPETHAQDAASSDAAAPGDAAPGDQAAS
jgi:predicted  nucleic acid-binding Zn-ribbon protein